MHNRLRQLGVFAAFAAFALAAGFSPAAVLPGMQGAADAVSRAASYWGSMMLGAAPFLVAGGAGAAAIPAIAARSRGFALSLAAVCLPVCDCAINACAAELARLPARVAAFTLTLGSCCNLLALVSTWFVLGPRLTADRVLCGIVAASCTALVWGRSQACELHRHRSPPSFLHRMAEATSSGILTFSVAAAIAACALVFFRQASLGGSFASAIALGALLSPCSSADALLAKALFAHPKAQLAFVIAAQCLDVRQVVVLVRHFGWRRAAQACASAATACALGFAVG